MLYFSLFLAKSDGNGECRTLRIKTDSESVLSTLRSVVGRDNRYITVSSHSVRVSILRYCVLVVEEHDCLVRLS